MKIAINQIGYKTKDKKVFTADEKCSEFKIVNKETGETVFKGKTTGGMQDKSTLSTLWYGDFSDVKDEGKYCINVNDTNSYTFSIDDNVYSNVKNALLKGLYFQRCGMKLDKKYAGKWSHEKCHDSLARLDENNDITLDVSGGWHDAGDYGRYTVPACKACADLMLSYELFKDSFKNRINIPESQNDMPDILSETKYELDWLFKMQDKETGKVYTKAATQYFPEMIIPEEDKKTIYVYKESTPAAGDFAAAMAFAARVYKPFDLNFSNKCLEASKKAFKWLEENEKPIYFTNHADMNSGEYGDNCDTDERFWAACELFRTTGETKYNDYLKVELKKLKDLDLLGWADMGGYGSISYLFNKNAEKDVYDFIKERFMSCSDELLNITENDGYGVSLKPDGYIWGSNMNVLNNAFHMIVSYMLTHKDEYKKAAYSQWNYILGKNSLGKCFVTGFGSNPVMNPHHRPSSGDGIKEPVPGLLSGGPCSWLSDDVVKKLCKDNAPAKCYADDTMSYSTNEITVYWNSIAVLVAGFMDGEY